MYIIPVSFTTAQIESKITAISDAIDIVLTGGKSYRLNDTQGDVQVSRSSLKELQNALDYWQGKLTELENTGSDIVAIWSGR